MPAVAVTTATNGSCLALKTSSHLVPLFVAAAAASRCVGVILKGCTRTSKQPFSISMSSHGPLQTLHLSSSRDKPLSHLSSASTSFFHDQDDLLRGMPSLPKRRRSIMPPRVFKNDIFSFKYPVITEKPQWWKRTLSCVPYLLALQISDVGFYLQRFLEHYDCLRDLIFFVPGAITRLPSWFLMAYCYFGYVMIVKNRYFDHFFRFHLMMGMLLETGLQVLWYTSNFFPLIHYNGTLGMQYWALVGFVYIGLLLHCIRCALAGKYAHIPIISDSAYIHTLFNIGGFQRPF